MTGSGAASGAGGRYPSELCGRSWLYWQRQCSTSTCASSSVSNRSRFRHSSRSFPLKDAVPGGIGGEVRWEQVALHVRRQIGHSLELGHPRIERLHETVGPARVRRAARRPRRGLEADAVLNGQALFLGLRDPELEVLLRPGRRFRRSASSPRAGVAATFPRSPSPERPGGAPAHAQHFRRSTPRGSGKSGSRPSAICRPRATYTTCAASMPDSASAESPSSPYTSALCSPSRGARRSMRPGDFE